jgi:hypothetical protein
MVKITFKIPNLSQPFSLDININTIGTIYNLK